MARVTVEDCAEVVQNRFELVALASQRSKSIASGSPITIERDNDKDAVVSLREIANKSISTEDLRSALIRSHQEHADFDQQLQKEFENESTQAAGGQFAEEMEDLQNEVKTQDADALLYGGDDVQAED